MHLLSPILLLSALASAFRIPEGQPQGIYAVSYAEDGTEEHILLNEYTGNPSDISARSNFAGPPSKRSILQARQIPNAENYIGCAGGPQLNVEDTNAANALLDAQCGNGAIVGPNQDFYSIVGCTVSYFCNFTWKASQDGRNHVAASACWAADRQALAHNINALCGDFHPGWDRFHSRLEFYSGQYGWEDFCGLGWNFCGRGDDGKRL